MKDAAFEVAAILRNAESVCVLTGAGVSAESGIPTFRDALTGIWAQFDPEELATPKAFERNPKLVWDWYAWRRELVLKAEPNPGHLTLAELEKLIPNFLLVTQNVDGLHERGGSQKMVELHGNITRVKCSREGKVVTSWADSQTPPKCGSCGAYLRPDVVWFGEALPEPAYAEAVRGAKSCDVFFSIGTSSIVYPAAGLIMLAKENGATVIEINPEETQFSKRCDYSIRERSAQWLPGMLAAWRAN